MLVSSGRVLRHGRPGSANARSNRSFFPDIYNDDWLFVREDGKHTSPGRNELLMPGGELREIRDRRDRMARVATPSLSAQRIHDVEHACGGLAARGEHVTFVAVSQRTGIPRVTLYRNPALRAVVEEHRSRAREATTLTDSPPS
jgi:hypothetical protein